MKFRLTDGKNEKGFTLLELLVVLVILGTLAGFITYRYLDAPKKAQKVRAKADIEALEGALKLYKVHNGYYPTTEQGLQSLVKKPESGRVPKNWQEGGYLEKGKVPLDPWENDYKYLSPGVHNPDFDLWSMGPDGEDGGEGDSEDITNWDVRQ